jgi:hypothetical protein
LEAVGVLHLAAINLISARENPAIHTSPVHLASLLKVLESFGLNLTASY